MRAQSAKRGGGLIAAASGVAARASNQLFLIAVILVATRYLGPAEFGVFSIAVIFTTLSRTLLYAGPFEYLMKASDVEGAGLACLQATLAMSALTALVTVGIALGSPLLFASQSIGALMLVLIPSNFIAAFASWQESVLLRGGKLPRYYVVTTGVELAGAGVAIALLLKGFGVYALAAQIYARSILLAICYRLMIRLPRLRRDATPVSVVLRWSVSRYGSVVVNTLGNYSGDLVLGVVLSPAAAGLYRASNRVAAAVTDMFAQPASMISMTSLSRSFARSERSGGRFLHIFAGVAMLGWPALLGVAIMADELTPIVLGQKWSAAAPIVSILAVEKLFNLANVVTVAYLVVHDKQHHLFRVQLAAACVALVLVVALASSSGVIGAAVAALIVTFGSSLALLSLAALDAAPSRADWSQTAIVVGAPSLATIAGTLAGRALGLRIDAAAWAQLAVPIGCGVLAWACAALLLRKRLWRTLQALNTHAS